MTLLKIFGFVHMLPNTLLALLWLAVMRLAGQVRPLNYDGNLSPSFPECYMHLAPAFLLEAVPHSRYEGRHPRTRGMCIGPFIVLFRVRDLDDKDGTVITVLLHELRHVQQQCWLGILMPLAYVVSSIAIWLYGHDKHAYYDNWFERDARRYAGQQVEIPRDRWPDGPHDRWPWW